MFIFIIFFIIVVVGVILFFVLAGKKKNEGTDLSEHGNTNTATPTSGSTDVANLNA